MRFFTKTMLWGALVAVLVCTVHSQVLVDMGERDESLEAVKTYPTLSLSGGLGFTVLRIINSTAAPKFVPEDSTYLIGMWMQNYNGRLGLNVYITEKLRIDVGIDGGIFHGLQTVDAGYQNLSKSRGISRGLSATGTYAIGEAERPYLSAKVGYFSFNYQTDIKNLGGFLFRSNTYPGVVYSGGSGAGFFGIGLNSTYVPNLRQDIIINLESRASLTCAYVFGYNVAGRGILDIGAGVVGVHLINFIPDDPIRSDRIFGFRDPIRIDPETGATVPRDTVWYTWRGAKVGARFRFDPKPLLGSRAGIFGDQDLWLYSEAAILGIKDYPMMWSDDPNQPVAGFDDIRERIPVMVGFNIPVFNILNYLNFEIEWYGSPYRNITTGEPEPLIPVGDRGKTDDIKWSVSLAKTVLEKATISLRAASDHLHTVDEDGGWVPDERLQRTNEWYIQFGLNIGFN